MIDIAVREKLDNPTQDVIITMAGNNFGPGNHCLNLPVLGKKRDAQVASDENNVRRSKDAIVLMIALILWQFLGNLTFPDTSVGDWDMVRQRAFAEWTYGWCKKRGKALLDVAAEIGVKCIPIN